MARRFTEEYHSVSSEQVQETVWPRCSSEEMRFPFISENHLTSELDKPSGNPVLVHVSHSF